MDEEGGAGLTGHEADKVEFRKVFNRRKRKSEAEVGKHYEAGVISETNTSGVDESAEGAEAGTLSVRIYL